MSINTPVVKNPNLREFKYQTIQISVTAAAAANSHADYGFDAETDKQYNRVVGVAFEVIPGGVNTNTDNLKIGKFEIQGREIYTAGLPVKALLYSSDVKFNDKFDTDINEEANGSKVTIQLSEYNSGTFAAYKVNVILKLSNRVADLPASSK